MQTLPKPFHQELGAAGLPGLQPGDVIRCARLLVQSWKHHRKIGEDDPVRTDAGHAERVVAGLVMGPARDAVGAGRKPEQGADVVDRETRALGRGVLGEQLDAEELVQEPDVARDDEETADRDGLLFASIAVRHFLEVDGIDPEIRHLGGEFGRELDGPREFAVEAFQFDRAVLEFRGRNDLGAEFRLRRGDRHEDPERLPAKDERHVEFDDAEVGLVEGDALVADLLEGQRPGRDARDEHLVEDMDRDAGRRRLEEDVGSADQLNVVELVVPRDAQRGEKKRFAVLGGQALRGEGRAAQRGFDAGADAGFAEGAFHRDVARRESDDDGSGDISGNRDGIGEGAELSADDAVFQSRERSRRGGRLGGMRSKRREPERRGQREHEQEQDANEGAGSSATREARCGEEARAVDAGLSRPVGRDWSHEEGRRFWYCEMGL